MTEQELIKKDLEEKLKIVKKRIEILNMIEERLFRMRQLAQVVIEEVLSENEIRLINIEVNYILKEIEIIEGVHTLKS